MASSKRKSKNKPEENMNDGVLDIQNMDLERADEFILSAKKKKLEDTYREDDQEDLLFNEQESKDILNKPKPIIKSLKDTTGSISHKSLENNNFTVKKHDIRVDQAKTSNSNHKAPENNYIVRKHERIPHEKHSLYSTHTQLENGVKRHSCKLEQRFNKHLKEQIEIKKLSNQNRKNEVCADINKQIPNERTIENPDFLKKILDKYQPHEQNSKDRLAPISTERRVSIEESATETEDAEPIIRRRSIRVTGIGLGLRQKMLQRLQAAQSRYVKTSALRERR